MQCVEIILFIAEKKRGDGKKMARPSRPARRAESVRGLNNTGYSAHYAESPVIPDGGGSGGDAGGGPPPPRASRRSIHSRSSTLPRGGDVIRSPSRHSRPGTQVFKSMIMTCKSLTWNSSSTFHH